MWICAMWYLWKGIEWLAKIIGILVMLVIILIADYVIFTRPRDQNIREEMKQQFKEEVKPLMDELTQLRAYKARVESNKKD